MYFRQVREKFPIRYGSGINRFVVVKSNLGANFPQIRSGLYYHDPAYHNDFLVNKDKDKYEGFTHCQYEDIRQARWDIPMVVYLPKKYFNIMVCYGMIQKWPVTLGHIYAANTIFRPGVPYLKGETAGNNLKTLVPNYVNILREILGIQNKVPVVGGFVFDNGMAFLVRISQSTKLTMVQYMGRQMIVSIDN